MAFAKNKSKVNQEQQDYQADDDARTMQAHQDIVADPDRHARATEKLGKKAQSAGDAHKAARKSLEKKTKGRLKKTFGQGGKDKAGGTFQGAKEAEQGPMEQVVGQDD